MVQKAAELGISGKMIFSGFLRGKEIDKAMSIIQQDDLAQGPGVAPGAVCIDWGSWEFDQ